jgi:tRNA pseudouridine55 synthase
MATGVLPIVYGKASSSSEQLMSGEKIYTAEMTLGIQTDTGDCTGTIIQKVSELPVLDEQSVKNIFAKLTGELIQTTPKYSAVKVRGRKLYEYARRGIPVLQPKRIVTIYSMELISINLPAILFRVVCSKGTYIRSLAEDIGRELCCPAVLSGLVREKSGPFCIQESIRFESVLKMNRSELLSKAVTV